MKVSIAFLLAFLILTASPAPRARGADPDKTEAATRQYATAVALQNRAVYDLAAEEWTKFINAYASDSRIDRAFHYLGICYLQNNQLETARQCFETVIKSYPRFELLEATYLHLGVTQYKLGQSGKPAMYDAAADTFGALIKNYPQGKFLPQALFNRGDCFYHRGRQAEAARLYAQVVQQFPNDKLAADALYALGVTQEELNQPAEAGKTYDEFLKRYPQAGLATEVIMRRGETLFVAGQYDAAAQWFATAAARPGFALADHATVRQAASLAQAKKYTEAAALYAALPARFPQSRYAPSANLLAGKCCYLAANYAAARDLLGKALAAGGEGSFEAAHWIARSLLKENKPTEALAVLDRVLPLVAQAPMAAQLWMDQADATYEILQRRGTAPNLYAGVALKFPQDPIAAQALYMAAFSAMNQGDYAAALRHGDAFLAVHPNDELAPDVLHVSAESNLQLGKYAEAEGLLAQALAKFPNHPDADAWKVRRGLALQLQKKHRETVALLQPLLPGIRNAAAAAEANFLIGGSQIELQQFAEAVRALEASLAAAPKWRQADECRLLLAQSYRQLGNVAKAKENVDRLIADLPESKLLDRAHYYSGQYAAAANDLKTAAAEYRTVAAQWPQSPLAPGALFGEGWALLGQNDFAAAEKVFSALVAQFPGDKLVLRSRYARGMARHQLGQFAQAIEDIQALLTAEPAAPERSDARYVLGLCQVGLKQFAEAAATFQTLLKDDPKYGAADKVLYELGWALKSQNKDQEAAANFTRLAVERPDSPLVAESHFHVGEAAYKAGDFATACLAYHAAVKNAGKTELGEKAVHKLGWAYFRRDKIAEAQQTFAYQRATWPNGPLANDAAFMEAECLFKQKKFDAALAAYESLKTPSSKDFQVLGMLHGGQAAAQLKQWEKSLALLSQCATQFAESPYIAEVLYEQGWALQNLGKLEDAAAIYAQVVAKGGGESAARAQFMIGEIQFQQRQHSEAVKSFFKVSYLYAYPQWQADAMYEAGRCFEVLDKKPQALKQYQELVEKFPQSDKTPLAKQRVRALQQ